LKDASFRLPPVTDVDAEEMIDRLRLAPLIAGYRGQPAGDRKALVDVIQRVSALSEIAPEIAEMDLNPVRLLEPGQGAVAVDARIRVDSAWGLLPPDSPQLAKAVAAANRPASPSGTRAPTSWPARVTARRRPPRRERHPLRRAPCRRRTR